MGLAYVTAAAEDAIGRGGKLQACTLISRETWGEAPDRRGVVVVAC